MQILGIESTCDETGVAVVKDGKNLISSSLATSLGKQAAWGGVIPEIAAREQLKVIVPTIKATLAGNKFSDIDAIAVSFGPGLIGPLLVGVETAKALSFATGKPLIAINHLVGHIFASWIGREETPKFPLVSLIVSGGHTDIVYMKHEKSFELIGSTLDDSAGEAFDKVARVLELGYPGGPKIEGLARDFKKNAVINFPKPMMGSANFDFSFSGIKTSVLNFVQNNKVEKSSIAYSFQESVCNVLVEKTFEAAKKKAVRTIVVGGGVSANGRLRNMFEERSIRDNYQLFFPQKIFSVDNGAMIATAAFYNQNFVDPLSLQANPNIHY